MKNLVLIMTTISLTMVYSCSQKESYLDEERIEEIPLTVKATLADLSDSKTILEDGNVLWTSGDEINLFFSSQSFGKFTTNIEEPSPTAEFSGTLSSATGFAEIGTTGKKFWAVYPYNQDNTCDGNSVTLTIPSVQASIAGSFADKLNPSVATSPGLDLAFYNVCAPFYFSVTQSGVTSATFRGNNDEDVAGQVRVTMDSNGLPVAEIISGQGAKSITITAPDGGFVPGTTYVLVLLPQTLSAGYTLALHKGNAIAECVVSKNAEFIRSQGRSKMNADEGLTYVIIPDAIDLGLSVKWGDRNVGAENPEDYGDYYAWGEIETKETYTWKTYNWCINGSASSLIKYNTKSSYGAVDNNAGLDTADDIAHVEFGGKWRMPTLSEFEELVSTQNNPSYTWEMKSIAGQNGWEVTCLNNGNSIFLPAAGYRNGVSLYYVDSYGYYWSSSLNTDYPRSGWRIAIGSGKVYDIDRCYGQSVRPVYAENTDEESDVESVELNKTELNLVEGASETLIATVKPDNAIDKTVTWTSSDASVAVIDNGKVIALKKGNVTITAKAGNQTATCAVVVYCEEFIDLGLSVKWATKNLGAETPFDYGNYYAWGEIETKENYSWSTYEWCNGTKTSLTKYNTMSSNGDVDNKTQLEFSDDVVHIELGGNWRMPTKIEIDELGNTKNNPNYKWEWKQVIGLTGYEITYLVNNKSIFLPAAGYYGGTPIYNIGSYGYFWSSSLDTDHTYKACYMYFSSENVSTNYCSDRYFGFSVRPVIDN